MDRWIHISPQDNNHGERAWTNIMEESASWLTEEIVSDTKDWVFFNSAYLDGDDQYKPDCIIYVPNKGFIIIEIKGGKDMMWRPDGLQIFYGENNPNSNAKIYKKFVNEQCNRIVKRFKEINNYKEYDVVWGSWIFSDSIDGSINKIKDIKQRTRYYDFLQRKDETHSFYNWAMNLFDNESLTSLTEDELINFRDTLFPVDHIDEFEAKDYKNEPFKNLQTIFDEAKAEPRTPAIEKIIEFYKQIDESSDEILSSYDELLLNQRVIVSGRAGTGKTHLVVRYAISMAEQGKKVLFLNTTKDLSNFNKNRYLHNDIEGKLEFLYAWQWANKCINDTSINTLKDYDILVIDEFHDLVSMLIEDNHRFRVTNDFICEELKKIFESQGFDIKLTFDNAQLFQPDQIIQSEYDFWPKVLHYFFKESGNDDSFVILNQSLNFKSLTLYRNLRSSKEIGNYLVENKLISTPSFKFLPETKENQYIPNSVKTPNNLDSGVEILDDVEYKKLNEKLFGLLKKIEGAKSQTIGYPDDIVFMVPTQEAKRFRDVDLITIDNIFDSEFNEELLNYITNSQSRIKNPFELLFTEEFSQFLKEVYAVIEDYFPSNKIILIDYSQSIDFYYNDKSALDSLIKGLKGIGKYLLPYTSISKAKGIESKIIIKSHSRAHIIERDALRNSVPQLSSAISRARNKVYYFILNNSKEVPKKPEISQIIREKLYNYLKKE